MSAVAWLKDEVETAGRWYEGEHSLLYAIATERSVRLQATAVVDFRGEIARAIIGAVSLKKNDGQDSELDGDILRLRLMFEKVKQARFEKVVRKAIKRHQHGR
jgi:hypothetical protein